MYYARVVFETDASTCERHEDIMAARRWIEEERQAQPESFRLGQIFEGTPVREVVATCNAEGWRPS